jgi:hypothetical protein
MNINSLKNYAIHGAIELLTGVGIGTVLTFLFINKLPPLEFIVPSSFGDPMTFLIIFSSNFIIFFVFGIYMGHIAENKKEFTRSGAFAGIFCGIAAAVLIGILTNRETAQFAICITLPGIAGLVFGVPRIRSRVLLDDGEVLEMYEHPTVNGEAATAIIDTQYGKALRITGSGDVEIHMQQSLGIQRGKQPDEAFGGFSLSMGNYTVGENDRTTDIRIYIAGEVDNLGISFSMDTGWGQILEIDNEKDNDPGEGWQVVRLVVSVFCYD